MKNKFKVSKDIFTSDKPNYYKINQYQDLLDLFQNGLLSPIEYQGFLKGCCYKYLVRMNRKHELQADVNKLIMYSKRLKTFELNEDDK